MTLDTVISVLGKPVLTNGHANAYLDLGVTGREGVFLRVKAKDVRRGHFPLVYTETLRDLDHETVMQALAETPRMQAALGYLFNDYPNRRTKLSQLIIAGLHGLQRTGMADLPFLAASSEQLEERIRKLDFTQEQISAMAKAVEATNFRTHPTIVSWINSKTVAPMELDYMAGSFERSALEQLGQINTVFEDWDKAKGEFNSAMFPADVRSAYWIYRDLVSLIVNYLQRGDLSKPSDTQAVRKTSEHHRPIQVHYPEEISYLVQKFIRRRTSEFSAPLATDAKKAASAGNATASPRPELRLSRGLVSSITPDFKGEIISIADLSVDESRLNVVVESIMQRHLRQHQTEYPLLWNNYFRPIFEKGEQRWYRALSLEEIAVGQLLVFYDPGRAKAISDAAEVIAKFTAEDKKYLKAAKEFGERLAELIRKGDNSFMAGIGLQPLQRDVLQRAIDIMSTIIQILPEIVGEYRLSRGAQRVRIESQLKREYGADFRNRATPFGHVIHNKIKHALPAAARNLGYGVLALDAMLSHPEMLGMLAKQHIDLVSQGERLATREQFGQTLQRYGLAELISLVPDYNFFDGTAFVTRQLDQIRQMRRGLT